jgi:predicted dithiol-disulfide oxidoreductase (DUF899 family)
MASDRSVPHPPIVTETEWLSARKAHLVHEKALTREHDRLRAERRRLPMVKVEKPYVFDGPEGRKSLLGLFAGQRQLIVYHFMFDPGWEKGCPGCTGFIDALGDLSRLARRNTTFVVVSRAPLPKLEAYKAARGWDIAWYSSHASDFNYDFHVTLDEKVRPIEYNYRSKAEMEALKVPNLTSGEAPGLSVFFRLDEEVFHTYSTYARGAESLTDTFQLLDVTPYGRQESFEISA